MDTLKTTVDNFTLFCSLAFWPHATFCYVNVHPLTLLIRAQVLIHCLTSVGSEDSGVEHCVVQGLARVTRESVRQSRADWRLESNNLLLPVPTCHQ